jgi:hypothetical protein
MGCYNIVTPLRRVTLFSHGDKTSPLPLLHFPATLRPVAFLLKLKSKH